MKRSTYTVAGMTCAHCVRSVAEEVQKVSGVIEVEVDLSTCGLEVTSDGPLADESIKLAVEEAGYELAGS
jgi:copper chaperone CopZ